MSLVVLSETRSDDPHHLTVPVSDRATVALAVGMALGGKTPIVELSSTHRLIACLEPLAEAASVAAAGEFPMPLVICVPYGGQAGDRIDRPVLDVLAGIDGLQMMMPSSHAMIDALEKTALATNKPTVLFEPRILPAGDFAPEDAGNSALILREGTDVTLIAFGAGVAEATDAAVALDAENISATVVDLVRLSPIDTTTVHQAIATTGRVVVITDEIGFGHRILRECLSDPFWSLETQPVIAPTNCEAIANAARATLAS